MKHMFVKSLAVLLIALFLVPAALAEDIAPVEAIDAAVPELDSVELDGDAELPVEAGFVSNESYQSDLSSYEAAEGIPIDEAHFPDAVVRNKLLNDYMVGDVGGVSKAYDQNRNGWLDTDEIAAITKLYIFDNVSDLRGIEYLTALETLWFNYTGTTLVVPPQIKDLQVSSDSLTALDLSSYTQLKSLSITSDSVTTVIFPASLEELYINAGSQIDFSAVDISRCTGLKRLYFYSEKMTSIDVSKYPTLESLTIGGKNLKTVTLGNQPNLKALTCWYNAMTTLDISGCSQLVPIINDKNKEIGETGNKYGSTGRNGAVFYFYRDGDNEWEVCISTKMKLITNGNDKTSTTTEKKSETVTPTADNTIVTSAKTTKTSVSVGQSYTISASGQKASGFKSSNSKVATVTKSGKIVPKKAGKVKITYKVNGKTRTVTLTIKDPTMPTKVSLNMTGTNAAKVGDKVTLTATLNEGAKSAIQWTTSDKKVATVKGGVVTFKKAGKVTITATTKRGNKKAKVKFTVTK